MEELMNPIRIFFSLIILVFSLNVEGKESMDNMALNPKVEDFKEFCNTDLKIAWEEFEKLQNYSGDKNVETVLVPLNNIWIRIDRSLNRAGLFQAVHPNPEMRDVAAECEQELKKLLTEINLSRPIYDAIAAINVDDLDPATKRSIEKTLLDFRRAGVDKDPDVREKIRALKEELVKIGQDFDRNIREDVRSIKLDSKEELAGLPQDFIDAHKPGEDGKITITTDYPDYIPFISYAQSNEKRFELYSKYLQRGYPKNEPVLKDMLEKRYELAKLLGYSNYAEYITEDKMVKTPEAAQEFIEKVASAASERADKDYAEILKRLKVEDPLAEKVGEWQKTYISNLVKRENYNFNAQDLRQYFEYHKVKKGLFDITAKMYNVEYKKMDIPLWDTNVEGYEIWSEGNLIGKFYLDMHPRKDKFKHAMMVQVITGIKDLQVPEAGLVCNFPGGNGTPALMEHQQVITFFHEFGHLLHHIFAGNQPWIGISGISTEWDFVEIPSTIFEEWAWNAEVLKTFAINETGDTIPGDLIERMIRAGKFRVGLDAEQQIYYAAISLNYYNRDASIVDPLKLMKKLKNQYTPFEHVDGTYMYLSFGHLNDYSAIYYTYKWSEVIAKDMFNEFQKNGLLNTDIALKFRHTILEPGGSKPASELVLDFLGRDYSFDAYNKWLNSDDI
jgi:thimet oligopeptidase